MQIVVFLNWERSGRQEEAHWLPSGRRDADDANVLFCALSGHRRVHLCPCVAGDSVALFAFGSPAASAPSFPAFLACLGRIAAALVGRRLGLGLGWFGRWGGRLRRCLRFFCGWGGWGGLEVLRRLGCRLGIVFNDTIAKQSGPSGIECFGACPRLGIRFPHRRRLGRGLRFCFAWGFCVLFGRGGVLLPAASVAFAGSLLWGFRCGCWRRLRRIYVAFDNIFVGESGA